MKKLLLTLVLISSLILTSCSPIQTPQAIVGLKILVVESFLGDIVENVVGDQAKIDVLIPIGLDPHAFEPTPQDIAKISEADVLIINGAGLEGWLQDTLSNISSTTTIIDASKGLTPRSPGAGEILDEDHLEGDPHFWLDPVKTISYVENIRDGMVAIDDKNKEIYTQNAADYIAQLTELDKWIAQQITTIPSQNRLLVTNHESFGYYADRYGLKVVGAIIPSVSTNASPSAKQLAGLINQIRSSKAPAIFLETGANPQLANQIASETGVKVITDLITHSLTEKGGDASTYLDMMRHNTDLIVAGLK